MIYYVQGLYPINLDRLSLIKVDGQTLEIFFYHDDHGVGDTDSLSYWYPTEAEARAEQASICDAHDGYLAVEEVDR